MNMARSVKPSARRTPYFRAFSPCFDRRKCVDTQAQDLGVIPGELGEVLLVRRHLGCSDWGERQRVKRHHDVLFAPEVRELNIRIQMRLQRKVRGLLADLWCIYILGHSGLLAQ